MVKLIVLILLMANCYAADILPEDKKWHMVAGFMEGYWLDVNTSMNVTEKTVFIALTGCGKEIVDVVNGGDWDSADILATIFGGLLTYRLEY